MGEDAYIRSPFVDKLGIEVIHQDSSACSTAITITEDLTNSLGIAHGGVIFTLADRAFGLACNRGTEPFVTMDMNIRYLRPAQIGQRLIATAKKIHAGRQTAFIRIDVVEEGGRLIACLSGTAHLMGEKKK